MSLLRQRATEASVLSTRSALRPALARLRLVSATRSAADEELNELISQAKVADGAANVNNELMPNRRTIARAVRRGDAARPRANRVERRTRELAGEDMRTAYSGGVRGYSGDVVTVGWGLGYVRGAMVPSAGAPRYRAVRWGHGSVRPVGCGQVGSAPRTWRPDEPSGYTPVRSAVAIAQWQS